MAFGRGNNTPNTKDAGNGRQFIPANPFGPQTDIFAGAIGFLLVNADALASAVPENNNKATIAYYSFFGLTFRKIFGLQIYPHLVLRVRRFDYTGQYPYDDAPGSFEQTQTEFVQKWIGGFAGPATTYKHYGHNFEATVSGLDLQNQNYSAATNWQSGNMLFNIDNEILNPGQVNGNTLSNPALSPFSAVITGTSDCAALGNCSAQPYKDENNKNITPPNSNQWNHYHNTDITFQFAQFIERNILNAQSLPCAGENGLCGSNPTISGPNTFCTTATFRLLNSPNGVTLAWQSVNGNVRITGGQGTNVITVDKVNNGNDIIRVLITNACGATLTVDYPVRVGAAWPDMNIYGPTSVSCGQVVTYQTSYVEGAGYEWSYPSSWIYDYGQGTWSITLQIPDYAYSSTSGDIRLLVHDACNNTILSTLSVYSSCGGYYYMMSPNPATSTVTVSAKETTAKGEKIDKAITEVNIYDQQGNLKKHQKFGNIKNATLNIAELKTGI